METPSGSLELTWQQLTGPGQVRPGVVLTKTLIHIKPPIEHLSTRRPGWANRVGTADCVEGYWKP